MNKVQGFSEEEIDRLKHVNERLFNIISGKAQFDFGLFTDPNDFIFSSFVIAQIQQFKVYRATFIDSWDARMSIKSRYSYPPIKHCRPGRCNVKGRPVLYCCSNIYGAIQEVMLNSDPEMIKRFESIHVSEWELTGSMYTAYDISKQVLALAGGHPHKGREVETVVNEYFRLVSSLFRTKRDHAFSSRLSDVLLYGNFKEPFKVIIYPTVISEKFINYAFHPSLVDENKLRLNKVFKIYLPRIDWEKDIDQNSSSKLGFSNVVGELRKPTGKRIFGRILTNAERHQLVLHLRRHFAVTFGPKS